MRRRLVIGGLGRDARTQELLAHAPCEPAKRVAILGDMLQLGPDAERHHLAPEPQRPGG